MSTWYLGPLGDLRAIVCPDRDIRVDDIRLGGVHQALSGARTVDITGFRQEFGFKFSYLNEEEYRWLEALHTRTVRGPFRLINPLKKNRLSSSATAMRVVRTLDIGIYTLSPYGVSSAFPSALTIPAQTRSFSGWTGNATFNFDNGRTIPVRTGETLTGSVYVQHNPAALAGCTLRLSWFDRNNGALTTDTQSFTAPTTFGRFTITRAAPANAAGAVFSIVTPAYVATSTLLISAPQVEAAATATAFEPGGGSATVSVDQLTTTSPIFPLRDCQLNLVEL